MSKRFGSVEAKTVPLTAVSPFNLLPFSRGKRGVKKPLTWLRRVNPCTLQNKLEYFKHVHVCMCVHGFYLQLMQEHMSPCQPDYTVHGKKKKKKGMRKREKKEFLFVMKKNLNLICYSWVENSWCCLFIIWCCEIFIITLPKRSIRNLDEWRKTHTHMHPQTKQNINSKHYADKILFSPVSELRAGAQIGDF